MEILKASTQCSGRADYSTHKASCHTHCPLHPWRLRRQKSWGNIFLVYEPREETSSKKEQCEQEAKPFALLDKLIKEDQLLGIEKAGLKEMLLAAQSLSKHVVAGKAQNTSFHTAGTTLQYYCY